MPKISVTVDGLGGVILTDANYIASGGEGCVYKKDRLAYKIYHDQNKMIPEKKIKELSVLKNLKNVLGPIAIVRDSGTNKAIGFTSNFIDKTNPLCKYFTKDFRQKNGFNEKDSVFVVETMQKTISNVHDLQILIVDLNEMNFLLDKKNGIYFIDVDSWQTKNFRATALMESIKDPLVLNNAFTEMSDWFAFAIVSFQIYIGIHPYKGVHPDYKPKDWLQRMKDGVSVFDKKAIVPSNCRPFSVIPASHLRWFEDVFKNNDRSIPPLPGDAIIPVVVSTKIITQNGSFVVTQMENYPENIVNVYHFDTKQETYTLTAKNLYITSRRKTSVWNYDIKQYDKVGICDCPGTTPLICKLSNNEIELQEMLTNNILYKVPANDFMVRNGRLYTVYSGQIYEYEFIAGKKLLYTVRVVCGCMENSTKVFDGVIYQDMLGQSAFTIPFQKGMTFYNIVKELRGYRVLDAKSEDNVMVVLAEKGGNYSRFVFVFENNFSSYDVRITENVSYDTINFTKVKNGPCVLVNGDKVEVFLNNKKVTVIDNSPMDDSTKLFNVNGKVHFISEKNIYSISTK